MKKIKVFVFATFVSLTWLSGCKTAQQAPIITKTEEEVIAEIPQEQGVTFFEGTLQAGLEKAKNENKLIFVDCYTTWCGPCKVLKQYTFKDANLGDFMKQNYICLAIDMEKPEGMTIAKRYGIEAYPTLLFLDKYGRVVNHQVGGIGAEALLAKAEQTVRKSM
ncbi:thioredoxin-like protein [Arcicella aurantiaca]|uniref:Thioredoxin-like protein n=1 Tax=Arcicella aurantiaca TaxID=591202 RepID=A0A316EBX4_9BACT|nr:thioredoxin family protein [Arcicella aurantiaca]PWK28337.1 thioredoxin-like protein [Arcicella aurantiaca]